MSTAAKVETQCVEIVAGLDESQICAAYELHREWAREEGCEIDGEGWVYEMRRLCGGGRYNLWVAWDGDSPVGVSELHLGYDARMGEYIGYGDRAYVLPKYRGHAVFSAIFESGLEALKWLGIKRQRCPAGVDPQGKFMQKFYESYDMKVTEVVLERVV